MKTAIDTNVLSFFWSGRPLARAIAGRVVGGPFPGNGNGTARISPAFG
jgi:hypothetical protein